MGAAIFYTLSFMFALGILILLPKTNKKLNIIVDVMFSYITILNLTAFIAFLINIAGISISLISMGIINS